MKKLFTLILTLAMVFAIAAPAMAAWGSPSSGSTAAPFTVSVAAVVPSTDSFGNSYYSPYNTATSIVPGAPLYVMITITVPSKEKLEAQYGSGTGKFTGEPMFSNLALLRVVTPGGFMDTKDASFSGGITADSKDTTTYTAVLLVTAQNALPAKLTYSVNYDSNYAKDSYTIGSLTITFNSDKTEATVTHSNKNKVVLTLDAKTKLVNQLWVMKIDGSNPNSGTYTVIGGTSFLREEDHALFANTSDPVYIALKAEYEKFTKDLGFGASELVYFSDANIRANYGLNSSKSASVEYTGVGAVPTPIIPGTPGTPGTGGSINVPNTGDSVSVLGYVMAGLAVLAAAVVIVRKVRA